MEINKSNIKDLIDIRLANEKDKFAIVELSKEWENENITYNLCANDLDYINE